MDSLLLSGLEESIAPQAPDNEIDPKETTKMPRGRRPKAAPPPKKFERQEALKNRIVGLSEELAETGFNDLLTPLVPIKPVAPEVVDEKTTARIGHVEETLAVYLQRTSIKDNLSQRPPFDHIADPIYRRLMRDFIQGAQMPEVKIAALRDLSGRIKSLDESGINYSIIDGLQRSWCYSTTVLLALHREKLVTDRCITVRPGTTSAPSSKSSAILKRRPGPCLAGLSVTRSITTSTSKGCCITW